MAGSPRVLFFFSNPADSDRLRLDREHKAIDGVLQELNLDTSTVARAHAVSVHDFPLLISRQRFEILHFSGHGSPDGIYLEGDQVQAGKTVSAQQLAAILSTAERPRVLVLMSCYSTDALTHLTNVAPYIITISGAADDAASIKFTESFYLWYFRTSSVEKSFDNACQEIEYHSMSHDLRLCLTRAAFKSGGPAYYVVDSRRRSQDSLLIDVSPVESQISELNVDRDRFFSVIGRKIGLHLSVFCTPRDRALVSAGTYFAEFSWRSLDDPIVCHRILALKENADPTACQVWARLMMAYNEFFSMRYRSADDPASPAFNREMKFVLEDYRREFARLKEKEISESLLRLIPKEYKSALAMFSANLDRAEAAYVREDRGGVVGYLEGALTTLHDLVDALTELNSVALQEE